MRILILGIDGMIGHKIAQSLSIDHQIIGSSRKKLKPKDIGLKKCNLLFHDFLKNDTLNLLNDTIPDLIINCAGITIRRGINENEFNTELLNSKLPHILGDWVEVNEKKLIHFSSDCVFSGKKGNYLDESKPDAIDAYGLSKSKGEIKNNKTLIIRCSIIGREIFNHTELFEWLNSMKNQKIEGYNNVVYSGVTSTWMGKTINHIIKKNIDLNGIYNISSLPISKFDLLNKLSESFNLNVDISANSNIKSNKVLISKKFTEITGINPPNWDDLIIEFKEDSDMFSAIYKN
ncbi:MAG: sugar nucleotide-binding protein [Flavobacteriaceae bacterium]|nr:sugar nucleotide-binding protein [Flavobacteriaceae bacterium]